MENQHRLIKGYKELTQEDIDLMNLIKSKGAELKELVEKLEANENLDKRWLDEATINLQTGFMQLTRAVTKPGFF